MPRGARDSDEESEPRSSTVRRSTRVLTSASVTDSPVRRSTRIINKQISDNSSPDSVTSDASTVIGRTLRSRPAVTRSMRSRKTSASSDVSEIYEVDDIAPRRVSTRRRSSLSQNPVATPTTTARSRTLRAGSETKSTPTVTRNKNVTRASSLDYQGNELIATPARRRTRASIVPAEPTVKEEEQTKLSNKTLENTVIQEDSGESSSDEEPVHRLTKTTKEAEKNIKADEEDFTDSEKPSLNSAKKLEKSLTDKSSSRNENSNESTTKTIVTQTSKSTLEPLLSALDSNECSRTMSDLHCDLSQQTGATEPNSLVLLRDKNHSLADTISVITLDNDSNDDENEIIDVVKVTESVMANMPTKEADDIYDKPYNDQPEENDVNTKKIDIKNAYVKLKRIEKHFEKVDENLKSNDVTESQPNDDTITKIPETKTAVVVVADCVQKLPKRDPVQTDIEEIIPPSTESIGNVESSNDVINVESEVLIDVDSGSEGSLYKMSVDDEDDEEPSVSIIDVQNKSENRAHSNTDFQNHEKDISFNNENKVSMEISCNDCESILPDIKLVDHVKDDTFLVNVKNKELNTSDKENTVVMHESKTETEKLDVLPSSKYENKTISPSYKHKLFFPTQIDTTKISIKNNPFKNKNPIEIVLSDDESDNMSIIAEINSFINDKEISSPLNVKGCESIMTGEKSSSINTENENIKDISSSELDNYDQAVSDEHKENSDSKEVNSCDANVFNRKSNDKIVSSQTHVEDFTNTENTKSIHKLNEFSVTENNKNISFLTKVPHDEANSNPIEIISKSENVDLHIKNNRKGSCDEMECSLPADENYQQEQSISKISDDPDVKGFNDFDERDGDLITNDKEISTPTFENKICKIEEPADVSVSIVGSTEETQNLKSVDQSNISMAESGSITENKKNIKIVIQKDEAEIKETRVNEISRKVKESCLNSKNIDELYDSDNIKQVNEKTENSVSVDSFDTKETKLGSATEICDKLENSVTISQMSIVTNYNDNVESSSIVEQDVESKDITPLTKFNSPIKTSKPLVEFCDTSSTEVDHSSIYSANKVEMKKEIVTANETDMCAKPVSNNNDTDDPHSEHMDSSINKTGLNEMQKIHVTDETDSQIIKSNIISGEDKNSVSSAVTENDEDNATSSPEEKEERPVDEVPEKITLAKKTPVQELKKDADKLKSKVSESDNENSVKELFRDIPADEWSDKSKVQNGDRDTVKKSFVQKSEEKPKNNQRNSCGRKSLSQESNVSNVPSPKAIESFLKMSRQSLEKKQNNSNELDENYQVEQHDDSNNQELDKTVGDNVVVDAGSDDENEDESCQEEKPLEQSASKELLTTLNSSASSQKGRKSLSKSLQARKSLSELKDVESESDESVSKQLATLNSSISSQKGRKSLNKSLQARKSLSEVKDVESESDESPSKGLLATLNSSVSSLKDRKSLNKSLQARKSLSKLDDVESESDESASKQPLAALNSFASPQKGRKSLNKSLQARKSLSDSKVRESESDEVSSSINLNISKSSNKGSSSSLSVKSMNTSAVEKMEIDDEDINEDDCLETSKKTLNISQSNKSMNKSLVSQTVSKNVSFSNKSLIGTSRKSLDKNMIESSEDENDHSDTDDEKLKDKSTRKSNTVMTPLSMKKDKSLREIVNSPLQKYTRISLNCSVSSKSDVDVSEEEQNTEKDEKEKKIDECLNVSKKSLKSAKNTPVKTPAKSSLEERDLSMSKLSPKKIVNKQKKEEELETSLKKNMERMRYLNPPKPDSISDHLSTIAFDGSDSDDNNDILFPSGDSDDSESNQSDMDNSSNESDDDEDESDNSIDSDIDAVYNLGGKRNKKYEDDDVHGDDCHASEEEYSDSEDNGSDLKDFITSDNDSDVMDDISDNDEVDVESTDDEDKENQDEDEDEKVEKMGAHKSKSNKYKSNQSVDDEDEEEIEEEKVVNKSNQEEEDKKKELVEKIANKFKSKFNTSKLNKTKEEIKEEKIANKSNRAEENKDEGEVEEEKVSNKSKSKLNISANDSKLIVKNKSQNQSLNLHNESKKDTKDHSFNDSKSKDKSSNPSKSIKIKSIINCSLLQSTSANVSLSDSSKSNLSIVKRSEEVLKSIADKKRESSHSLKNTSQNTSVQTQNFDESSDDENKIAFDDSKAGFGENEYRIITVKPEHKLEKFNKNITLGIEASTPLPKRTADDEISQRWPWSQYQLSQTAQAIDIETPTTKYLKKSKLNDSVPILESMKNSDLDKQVKSSKSRKVKSTSQINEANEQENEIEQIPVEVPKSSKKSKKRKLVDVSLRQSHLEDSILKELTNKKKRARVEEIVEQDVSHNTSTESTEPKKKQKKKKNDLSVWEETLPDEDQEKNETIESTESDKKENKQVTLEDSLQKEDANNVTSESTASKKKKKKKKKKQASLELSSQNEDEKNASAESTGSSQKENKQSGVDLPKEKEKNVSVEPTESKKKKKKNKQKSLLDESSQSVSAADDTAAAGKKKKKAKAEVDEIQFPEELYAISAFAAANQKKQKNNPEKIKVDKESFKGEQKTQENLEKEIEAEQPDEDTSMKKKKKSKKTEVQVVEEPPAVVAYMVEKQKKKKKKSLGTQEAASMNQEEAAVPKKIREKDTKRLSNEKSDQENLDIESVQQSQELRSSSESRKLEKKSKKRKLEVSCDDDEAPDVETFDEARRSALKSLQQVEDSVKAQKENRKKKQREHAERKLEEKSKAQETKSLERLPVDVLEKLTDKPLSRAVGRQKLSKNTERKIMDNTPVKVPRNVQVNDGFIPLSSQGGTTRFGIVELNKAAKVIKTNINVINFREKMLSRNVREAAGAYIIHQQKLKAKNSL